MRAATAAAGIVAGERVVMFKVGGGLRLMMRGRIRVPQG